MGSWGWASEQGGGLCHASAELSESREQFLPRSVPLSRACHMKAQTGAGVVALIVAWLVLFSVLVYLAFQR